MPSYSIRIDAQLFHAAQAEAAIQSRSTAQQLEHWARIGAALETCGVSVNQVAALLATHYAGDAHLWASKRAQQEKDLTAAAAGRLTHEQLSWFSDGRARKAKLTGSAY